ncbi:LytTR family DNA-binding domain-containing protein [Lacrimispora amygdalina]|uniref:LytTR family DNA-binding domain-containing protein n=1 Tax=Lacrimispora amygdalina TaxID=253257 RepID=UPI000BE3786B
MLQWIFLCRECYTFGLHFVTVLFYTKHGNDIMITTDDNCIYTVQHTLQFWEKKLIYWNFYRCHKCYIVNIEKVTEIIPSYNSTFLLRLEKHKNTVPVGRKFIKEFKEIIGW